MSQDVNLIDNLATGEGKETEQGNIRINISVITLYHRSEITIGAVTTELASLNAKGKEISGWHGPSASTPLPKAR